MSTHTNVCRNPNCRCNYSVNEHETDDGYCCFACWEEANCSDPQNTGDVLETHVEEIIKYG